MAETVYLPGGVTVFVNAVTNAAWKQRVRVQANGIDQTWEGSGEDNAQMGGMNVTPGVSFPDNKIRVTAWHSSDGGATWAESPTQKFSSGNSVTSTVMVGAEDSSDNDYNDAIVSFTWFN